MSRTLMLRHAEKIWLTLIGLTFIGVFFAETGHAGWPLTLAVVCLIAFKMALVVDHYMEMRHANRRIRNILRIFITLVPLMVILSHGWGETIRRLTTLG